MAQTLRTNFSNTDIVISDTVIDSSGNAVTTGQTVEFNIQRLSDNMWWGGTAFDQGSEPGGFLSAAQVGTTGNYEHTLSSGFDESSLEYRVHHKHTGTVVMDFYDTDNIETGANVVALVGETASAVKMRDALRATVKGKVNTIPAAAGTLLVKELSNDAAADLNVADVLKNRVLTFTSGLVSGHTVGILASAASASDPITLTVTDMANFANIAVDDEFVIT